MFNYKHVFSYNPMTKPRGGRGHHAPYESIQVACPLPIKPAVEELIEEYRTQVLEQPESADAIGDKLVSRFQIKPEFEIVPKKVSQGGRGKKLPYERVQVRCPMPIKPAVEELIDRYRSQVLAELEQAEALQNQPAIKLTRAEEIKQKVLSDRTLTRGSKDRAAINRGIDRFIEELRSEPDSAT